MTPSSFMMLAAGLSMSLRAQSSPQKLSSLLRTQVFYILQKQRSQQMLQDHTSRDQLALAVSPPSGQGLPQDKASLGTRHHHQTSDRPRPGRCSGGTMAALCETLRRRRLPSRPPGGLELRGTPACCSPQPAPTWHPAIMDFSVTQILPSYLWVAA